MHKNQLYARYGIIMEHIKLLIDTKIAGENN